MIRLFITGITGAMGQMIVNMSSEYGDFKVVGGLGKSSELTTNYPIFTELSQVDQSLDFDVLIDFSTASLVNQVIDFAKERFKPAVICTTGLSAETEQTIKDVSKDLAIFKSGNMSVGVHLISKLLKQVAQVIGESNDIEIIEKHHRRKVDSPSGTAIMLADAINSGLTPNRNVELGRKAVGSKDREAINIHSVRGGTIVGEHEVIFAGEDEVITLSHGAYSRRVFAKGALDAAMFIWNKPSGLYDMNDLLEEKLI